MNIQVSYYAQLKEWAQLDQESIATTDGDTPRIVYDRLAQKYDFSLSIDELRVAINDEFSDADTKLTNDDRLVFIPPVAGG